MRKLLNGVLIGFGSALALIVSTAWCLLWMVLDSGYFVVTEAKVITAAYLATNAGVVLGILLLAIGLGIELFARKRGHLA